MDTFGETIGFTAPSCNHRAMQCPFCDERDTRVVDSRTVDDGARVRRRRQCTGCKKRFTTCETADPGMPCIAKRGGARDPFDEDKLRAGILRALEKRPVTDAEVEAALGRLRRRLMRTQSAEIASRAVGEMVMDELHGLDQVAYVRFASVYRDFQDVGAFGEEIARLENRSPPEALHGQLSLLPDD